MATVNISEEEFEKIIPVGASAGGEVFATFMTRFDDYVQGCTETYLGEVGLQHMAELQGAVKQYAALSCFLDLMAQQDVVLTDTGFGVVSNNQLAPASRDRVDAVRNQLATDLDKAEGALIDQLSRIEGWGETAEAKLSVEYVIHTIGLYRKVAKSQLKTHRDWEAVQPFIRKADAELRRMVGDACVDHLLDLLRCHKSDDYTVLLTYAQRFTLFLIDGDTIEYKEWGRKIMSLVEGDLQRFSLYAESDAYQANHEQRYENHEEDPCYFFS